MKAATYTHRIYKIYLLLLLCFLSACSKKQMWVYFDEPKCHVCMLTSQVENKFSEIEVQLMKGDFGILCYLSVYMRQIPMLGNDPKQALAVIEVEKQRYAYKAALMEGSQRLLLPKEATEQLIEALGAGLEVTVYLDGYISKIQGTLCAAEIKKFQKS